MALIGLILFSLLGIAFGVTLRKFLDLDSPLLELFLQLLELISVDSKTLNAWKTQ